jgi:hypothetical protein
MRPKWQALQLALVAHFLKPHAKGNVVIFPRDISADYCYRHSLMWNLIVIGLAEKEDLLMRLISNPFMLNEPDVCLQVNY